MESPEMMDQMAIHCAELLHEFLRGYELVDIVSILTDLQHNLWCRAAI